MEHINFFEMHAIKYLNTNLDKLSLPPVINHTTPCALSQDLGVWIGITR